MKRNAIAIAAGLAIAALVPATAFAHTDVSIGVGLGGYVEEPPVYYAPAPVYYQPAPVYYHGYRDRDWYIAHQRWKEREHARREWRDHDDYGRHRGW